MDRSHRTSLFVLTASLILIAVSGCTVTRSRQTPARTGPDGPKNGNRSVVEKGARTVVDRGPSDRAASRPTLNARVTDGRGGGQSRGSPSRGLERRSPRAPEHAGQQASLRATIRSTDVGGAAAAETGRDHAVEPPRGNMGQGSSKNPPKGPPFAQDDLPGNVAGVPSCEPIADVLCGDVVENDTSFYQDFNSIYDCLPGWLEDGPEIAYRFKTEQVVQVTATLSGLDAGVDLDVFVLTQACVPETCIAFGHVAATFNAVPGTEYFIVVDGYERAAGQFVLTITCATPEICDDGRDNDGDDLVDCVDPDCANDPACASTGACCFDGGCEPGTFREWCESQNGTWHAGLGCADVECPQACCATDGTCSDVLPTTCLEQGRILFLLLCCRIACSSSSLERPSRFASPICRDSIFV